MKFVIVMNLPYHPAHGGANKSNRIVAELLAARSHDVHVVTPALDVPPHLSLNELRGRLQDLGAAITMSPSICWYRLRGVDVRAVTDRTRLRDELIRCIKDLDPDWVIVSSEDPSQNLLHAALTHAPGRVAYMLLTPSFLPFGPLAFYPGEKRTALFGQVTCIVATSRFAADYVQRWSPWRTSVCHLPVYGDMPAPLLAAYDGFITLVNACQYKGIEIFARLAEAVPQLPFAAVRGWGTTSADLARLHALPNVTVLEPRDDIDEILARTRILLMPSLWLENFSLTAIEALLRGIPVLASEVGGLREAKLGTNYVLPVRPIEGFAPRVDENQLPVGIVPEQDIEPWREALVALLDADRYKRESEHSRTAATRFAGGLHITDLEAVLVEARAARRVQVTS